MFIEALFTIAKIWKQSKCALTVEWTKKMWYTYAAAAAKSLQLCQTLCNPIDGSPSGSPIPGTLQARSLEWVAISFSNAWKWKVKVGSHLVMSDSQWPLGLQSTRLLLLHCIYIYNGIKKLMLFPATCGEGNGTPLQYSCLENPMDGGARWAAVHGIAKSQTRLSDFIFTFHFSLSCIGGGNGNLLQCSCLENPRDGGAWWAAVYGVTQSRTWLKRLINSSSNMDTTRDYCTKK